jgi:peptidoglycan-associated lipoprotein
MKPMLRSSCARTVLTSATIAMLVAACSVDRQTALSPPPSVETGSIGATNLQANPSSAPPDTPTAFAISVSADVLRACSMPDADASFSFDASSLISFDRAPLDAVATCFSSGPLAGHTLKLVGHADSRGTRDHDVTFAQARADNVASYLTTHGMLNKNVTSTSRGLMDAAGHDEPGLRPPSLHAVQGSFLGEPSPRSEHPAHEAQPRAQRLPDLPQALVAIRPLELDGMPFVREERTRVALVARTNSFLPDVESAP